MNETGSPPPLLPPPDSSPLPPPATGVSPDTEGSPSAGSAPAAVRGVSLLRDSVLPWLRRALPAALMGFALLFSASASALFLSGAGITGDRIARFLLADAAGGAEHLRRTEASLLRPLSPEGTDALLAPSPALTLPYEEEETVPAPEIPGPAPGDRETAEPRSEEPEPMPDTLLRLSNETAYRPDMAEIAALPRAIPPYGELREIFGDNAPVVLILHTHTTEAYAESAAGDWRSMDPERSVVSVGEVLARGLREAGIPVLHLTDVFDAPDFNMAYFNAAEAIREAALQYPSIRYIFDVHRDSVRLPDGTAWAPRVSLGEESAARIMFVAGTDEAGASHPGWRDNLALAARLRLALESRYPGLTRDINLRSASFNEQYAPGALLVEIGASGNTLEEARAAAGLLAETLAEEILG